MRPDFDKVDGMVPAIAQDARTGRVLTQAFQDEEAWEATLATGQVHYRSRSRDELWRKGGTSGHVQEVVGVRLDCDADSVLMLVDPAGPACHTGETSCFHQGGQGIGQPILGELWQVLLDRDAERPDGSWTAELLADPGRLAAKIAEEAGELTEALADEPDDRVAEEAADLVYHLMVGLVSRGVPPEVVVDVLRERMA